MDAQRKRPTGRTAPPTKATVEPAPQARTVRRVARIGSRSDLRALADALGTLELDERRSCSQQVLDLLRHAIIRAQLTPGTPLSEAALARILGVSRTPVREALRALAREQLVRVYPQAATVVAPIDIDALQEGCFIRRSLECANIAELAGRITARDLAALRELLKAQRAAIDTGKPDAFFRLDEAMHRQLFDLTHRRQTWARIEEVKQHLDRVRWLLQIDPVHASRALDEHEELVALLRKGDGAGAAAAMYRHIDAVTRDVERLRDRAPAAFFAS
jgi:DNA-binding GntR family transcriptional regulator